MTHIKLINNTNAKDKYDLQTQRKHARRERHVQTRCGRNVAIEMCLSVHEGLNRSKEEQLQRKTRVREKMASRYCGNCPDVLARRNSVVNLLVWNHSN